MQTLTTGDQVAEYRIESFVARGGMAVVYRATDLRLGRPVALKLLAPEWSHNESFQRRFMRESQLAASIDHPNIIPVYEAGKAEDLLYIAMRYVDGSDLSSLLGRDGPMSLDRALPVLHQVASALDAAHARGLVHRDVKPGNILVASGGRAGAAPHVYLSDFGLTKRAESVTDLTSSSSVMGTIDYIAPEQISGEHIDGRTDVYALGCVGYRMLTGSTPFERDNDAAVLYAHLTQEPPRASVACPGLPGAIDDVLARAMAKDPENRYRTCLEFIRELRQVILEEEQPAVVPPGAGRADHPPTEVPPNAAGARLLAPPGPRPAGRRRTAPLGRRHAMKLLAGGALIATALVAVGAVRVFTGSDPPASVVLPFAAEIYSGFTVTRTWALSGRNGDRLHGELKVAASKPVSTRFLEVLPLSTVRSRSDVHFTPPPAAVERSGTKFTYRITNTTNKVTRWTFTYDVDLAPDSLTVARLHSMADALEGQALDVRRRDSVEEPDLVTSLVRGQQQLSLRAGGPRGSLEVTGQRTGQTVHLRRVRYDSEHPEVASVDNQGVVTPLSPGTALVTARLGWLVAKPTKVTVRP